MDTCPTLPFCSPPKQNLQLPRVAELKSCCPPRLLCGFYFQLFLLTNSPRQTHFVTFYHWTLTQPQVGLARYHHQHCQAPASVTYLLIYGLCAVINTLRRLSAHGGSYKDHVIATSRDSTPPRPFLPDLLPPSRTPPTSSAVVLRRANHPIQDSFHLAGSDLSKCYFCSAVSFRFRSYSSCSWNLTVSYFDIHSFAP